MPTFIASAWNAVQVLQQFRKLHMQQELALKHDFVRSETNRGTYTTYLNMGWSEETSFRPVAAHLTTIGHPEHLPDTTCGNPQVVNMTKKNKAGQQDLSRVHARIIVRKKWRPKTRLGSLQTKKHGSHGSWTPRQRI